MIKDIEERAFAGFSQKVKAYAKSPLHRLSHKKNSKCCLEDDRTLKVIFKIANLQDD